VLAEVLLGDERAQALLGSTEVRSMLLWHAIEESEHRSVAFDVYEAAGGTERRRIWVMRAVRITFWANTVGHALVSLLGDPGAYHPVRLTRSIAALRHSPFLTRAVRHRLAAYTQRGFHPDDTDNTGLLQHWTAELFGEHGTLAAHLR
jgi:predicted metal-dependent hydrolase